MICYLRTSAASYDIRLRKYISACQQSGTKYIAITWDRLLECKPLGSEEIQFKHKASYGLEYRKRNFLLYIGWIIFAFFHLIKERKRYKVIHACNVETVLLAYVMGILFHKKIIFDIYDTSGKYTLERFFAKRSDIFILPHELRSHQIGFNNYPDNLFVVENVPYFQGYQPKNSQSYLDGKLHISYVGVFQRKIRGIENLIKLVEHNLNLCCEIAGSGDGLENDIIEASKRCNRIKYHGKVNYNEALEIMSRSDVIFACYYLSAKTHKYASPNKYYESLFLGKPIITSKNTLVGDRVKKDKTGFLVGDNYSELQELISTLKFGDFENLLKEISSNAKEIWNNTYSNYFERHMKCEYINKCKEV